jgi:hypothetical protein
MLPIAPSASAHGGPADLNDFDPDNFPAVPNVDNRWLPLVPGMQFVLVGQANRGKGQQPHRVVTVVTDLIKVVDGVTTVVVYDRDIQDGELVEAELAFWAQDKDGTVWNLGEYPEEFEDGEFIGAPSTWISGVARARAGILMQAHPRVGTPSYSQGLAPAIEFADRAKVVRKGEHTCVPVGCFSDVLVIDERNPLEPADGHQLKYHAPGVGIVRVGAVGGEEQETLVLTKAEKLSPDESRRLSDKALELDNRAYRVAKPLYAGTQPAQHRPGP